MDRLYRILLVDDEAEVRQTIIKKIEWEKVGFDIVGDAENGVDALEKVEQLEPDLILTDIRMPYMDGLQLAEQVRKFYPSVKVMLFSGYDDFEYAKQAIKLNIIEYILKPVNAAELTEILVRIKNTMDAELSQMRDTTALRESYIKNLPILRQNFLYNLIRGKVPQHRIASYIEEYRLDLNAGPQWVVAVCTTPQENRQEVGENMTALSVKRVLDKDLGAHFQFSSFHNISGLAVVICLEIDGMAGVIAELDKVCHECRRILDINVTIGVGQPVVSLASVQYSYAEAKEAAGYQAFGSVGEVIYINDVEPLKQYALCLDDKEESELVAAIKFGESQTIVDCVKHLAEQMQNNCTHESQYQAFTISVFNVLLKLIQRYQMDPTQIFGTTSNYYEILGTIHDAESFYRFISKASIYISNNLSSERQDTAQGLVRDAKEYIAEHYNDPELSLESICQELHISTSYFSTVFKRDAGESFTSYLTQVRLAKAAELLKETDDKTYQVAKAVGYYEPNYFGYVFKKMYGVSPNKFRQG